MSVTIGQPIPDFTIIATSDKTITLSSLKNKKIVIYFYPKDYSLGCTSQAKDFRDYYNNFIQNNTVILGISKDNIATHNDFKTKHHLPFELLSDTQEILCQLFDVIKFKKLYGKEYFGIERSTFLINEQGILQQEWRKVRVSGHVLEVLENL